MDIQEGPITGFLRKIKISWVVALVCLGLVLGLRSPLSNRWALSFLQGYLQERAYLTLSFSHFEVSLLPLSLRFEDVQLAYDSPLATAPMVKAKEIKLRASLLGLLLDTREKFSLTTQDLVLRLDSPQDLPSLLKKKDATPSAPIRVSQIDQWIRSSPLSALDLRNTSLYFSTPFGENASKAPDLLRFSIEGADLAFHTHADEPKGQMKVGAFSLSREHLPIVTRATLAANIRYEMGSFLFSEIKSPGPDLTLAATGSLSLLSADDIYTGMEIVTQGRVETSFSFLGGLLDLKNTAGTAIANTDLRVFVPTVGEPDLSLQGDAVLRNATLDGYKLFDSTGAFFITLKGIELSNLEVIQQGKRLATGEGYISFAEDVAYRFTGKPDQLGFVQLLDALKVSFSAVDFSIGKGSFSLAGTGTPFLMEVNGKLPLSQVRMKATASTPPQSFPDPICQADLKLSIDEKALKIHQRPLVCTLHTDTHPLQSTIQTGGMIFLDEERIALSFQSQDFNLQLAQATFQLPLSGKGQLHTTIEGPFEKVIVKNQFALKQIRVKNIPVDHMTGLLQIQNSKFSWGPLQIQPDAKMQITSPKGSLDFDTHQYEFLGKISDVTPSFLNEVFQLFSLTPPISFGVRSFAGEIKGNWEDFFQLNGKGSIQLTSSTKEKIPIDSTIAFQFLGKDRSILLEGFEATTGNQQVAGTLSMKRRPLTAAQQAGTEKLPFPGVPLYTTDRIDLSLHAVEGNEKEAIPTKTSGSFPFLAAFFPGIHATGSLQGTLQLTGTPHNLQGEIDLITHRLAIQGKRISPLHLKGFIRQSILDSHIEYAGNTLQGRFSVDLKKPSFPYQGFANFENLDFRFLFPSAYAENPRNYFYFTGNLQLSGYLVDIWKTSGFLTLSQAHHAIAYGNHLVDFHLAAPATLLLNQGVVTYKEDQPLELVGDALQTKLLLGKVVLPHTIEASISSHLNLSVLSILFPDIESSSGYASIETRVWGGIDDLQYQIDAKSVPMWKGAYTPISVLLAKAPPRLDDIDFHLLFSNGILEVKELRMRKGEGWIQAKGSFIPSPAIESAASLTVSLENARVILPVAYIKNLDMAVSGTLYIANKEGKHFVSGALQLPKCNSNKNFDLKAEIIEALRSEKITTSTTSLESSESIYYDISLVSDRTIKIQSKDVNLVASADLKLSGNNLKPLVIGEVTLDRGKFYYKKEFTVIRGHATFDNPVQLDPRVNLLAQATVGNYQVGVEVDGPLSDMTMRVFTDPMVRDDGSAITQLDALVLLSTGNLPEPGKQSFQSGGVGASEAINAVSSQLPFTQVDELLGQKYLNFYIDMTTDENGVPTPRLNVPIYIIEGIDAVIRSTPNKQEFSAEAPLNESVAISGNVSNEQKTSTQTNGQATSVNNQVQPNFTVKFKINFK